MCSVSQHNAEGNSKLFSLFFYVPSFHTENNHKISKPKKSVYPETTKTNFRHSLIFPSYSLSFYSIVSKIHRIFKMPCIILKNYMNGSLPVPYMTSHACFIPRLSRPCYCYCGTAVGLLICSELNTYILCTAHKFHGASQPHSARQ